MKWITREHVRIDRVAIPWLVKRFIDPDAEFLFVPRKEALERAHQEGAIPFDVPGAELDHEGDKTGFDAVIAKYNISDPAIARLADIVRGADMKASKGKYPESAGLEAVAHGFFLMKLPDQRALELQFPLYDALYQYCQDLIKQQARHPV
jgi:hypothetical protein